MPDEREKLAAELKRAIEFMNDPQANRRPIRRDQAARKTMTLKKAEQTALPLGSAVEPRQRSISFTPALLDAVLAGTKVVTRRPIRPKPVHVADGVALAESGETIAPIYHAGDRLWIQEKWARCGSGGTSFFVYERDRLHQSKWISSRFMPRVAARSFLRVGEVGISRLKSITDAQAVAEGVGDVTKPVAAFIVLWDSIYGETEFASCHDPWVWTIAFTREASRAPE